MAHISRWPRRASILYFEAHVVGFVPQRRTMNDVANDSGVTGSQSALPTVLVVDDSEPTAHALGKIFSTKGFNSAVVHRGGDALAYAADHTIHAAIVDLHLPDLSGLVV